jgi:hypothetical protein
MRRRWRYRWGTEWIKALGALYIAAGLVAAVVLCFVDADRRGGIRDSARLPLFAAWLGPYVLIALGWALVGLAKGFAWVVRHPPIERVVESVEDLREHYRR